METLATQANCSATLETFNVEICKRENFHYLNSDDDAKNQRWSQKRRNVSFG